MLDAVKLKSFYDLSQSGRIELLLFQKEDGTDLIDVIVRVAIGKHREWILTETSNINSHHYPLKTCFEMIYYVYWSLKTSILVATIAVNVNDGQLNQIKESAINFINTLLLETYTMKH